eukprot:218881_1
MATNAIELDLATAIDSTEQKEEHNNNHCDANIQNQTFSNDRNDAAPPTPPLTKNEEDCGAPPQQSDQCYSSTNGRPRASSDPEYLNTTLTATRMLPSSHSPRRFSADMDAKAPIQYEEPPTREEFTRDMRHRDMIQMLSQEIMIKPMHNTRLICYIYDGGKIKGPHTCDEIVSLYVYNQIQDDIIYISSATANKEWYKLEIPPSDIWDDILYDYSHGEGADLELGEEYLEKNNEIKTKFPELYNALIINVIKGKVTKIDPPLKIPEDVQKRKSIASLFVPLLGKIVACCTLIIIALHLVPFVLLSFAYWRCIDLESLSVGAGDRMTSVFYIIMFCGFVAPPLIMTWLLLSKLRLYDEIQSWMIAYIVWGIFTFMVLTTYTILTIILQGRKQKKYLRTVNRIIFFIVAIDFGAFDIISMLSAKNVYIEDIFSGQAMGLVTFFLQMPIASLLPSAVCGFIANYILQEKFELKCRTEIVNTNICFNSLEYGCCEVISSHNWMNSYAFMGRFASNILAVWAIIRICGYLLANARSDYAIHAKRTK